MSTLLSLLVAIFWIMAVVGLIRPEALDRVVRFGWTRKRVCLILLPAVFVTNLLNLTIVAVQDSTLNPTTASARRTVKKAELVPFEDLTEQEKDYIEAFLDAVKENNAEKVITMLDAHPQLLNCTYAGDTRNPLIATLFGPSQQGETPLYDAVRTENPEMVRLLLERGANPDGNPASGTTPLRVCASSAYYKLDVLRTLLEYGADPNIVDFHGRSPLHVCCDVEGIKALLMYGADRNIRDKDFDLPEDVAGSEEAKAILRAVASGN